MGLEDPLEKEIVAHSRVLTWEIPWTEEPGGLQSTGLQRVRYNSATKHTQMLPLGSKTHRHDSTIGLPQVRLPKPHY